MDLSATIDEMSRIAYRAEAPPNSMRYRRVNPDGTIGLLHHPSYLREAMVGIVNGAWLFVKVSLHE